ncbi:unnamed protein product [Moneuplotes crassus]|uniref:Uncharacterized protein n=1 Tax=Euplotes crassus TaxID=5936 RepID=A0AAD1XTI2_EUPCR|nr:unnamed protein product [Moneuplotes crassus]
MCILNMICIRWMIWSTSNRALIIIPNRLIVFCLRLRRSRYVDRSIYLDSRIYLDWLICCCIIDRSMVIFFSLELWRYKPNIFIRLAYLKSYNRPLQNLYSFLSLCIPSALSFPACQLVRSGSFILWFSWYNINCAISSAC